MMTKKKKKMMMKKKKSISPDRISDLPDELIHLIVQSLPSYEEATRTSILSRRWLKLWSTYPVVGFDCDRQIPNLKSRFQFFAAATSKRLTVAELLLLDSFTISLEHVSRDLNLSEKVSQLMSVASIGGGNRSPLKVVVKINKDISDSFEGRIFLNCGRTKFLHLKGFNLSGLHNFQTCCLDNLRELCLESVRVSQQSFPSCLANAFRLEKLSLKYIFGVDKLELDFPKTCLNNLQELSLQDVQVSKQSFPSCLANARRLEKLSLKYIRGIDRLDISASDFPSLKSLSFQDDNFYPPGLQLTSAQLLRTFRYDGIFKLLTVVSAPNVTSLELEPHSYDQISRSFFDELISKFPSLESLDFDACHASNDRLRISAHTLRKLIWKQRWNFGLKIDAPNLVTLFITTMKLPTNINIVNVASPTSRLCVVDCSISETRLTTHWFLGLSKCLDTFATRFRHLVFNLNFLKAFNVDSLCESSPLRVQHLLLGIDLPSESLLESLDESRFLDGILSAIRPKTLLIAQPRQNRSLLSYISEQMERRRRRSHRNCCRNGQCWRQEFRDTKITSITVDDISTIDKPMFSQPSINMILKMPCKIV
ncbi:F-box/LRR-repeat protein 25 [Linum grandiflorum]